jgi:hypothetical protein
MHRVCVRVIVTVIYGVEFLTVLMVGRNTQIHTISCLARLPLNPRFAGLNLAEGNENLQHIFLWKGSKAAGSISQGFTAC